MGKTYRNVYSGSNSVDYHSPHHRGFAKIKKRRSHKQIRNINRFCDEWTFQKNSWMHDDMYMKNHWASLCFGKIGNIGNTPDLTFSDVLSNCCKWKPTTLDILDEVITKSETIDRPTLYLIATKKQIKRRGKLGLFKGYSKIKFNK
jgi:hypothetical protein